MPGKHSSTTIAGRKAAAEENAVIRQARVGQVVGGEKRGPGRPKGSKNQKTIAREQKEAAQDALSAQKALTRKTRTLTTRTGRKIEVPVTALTAARVARYLELGTSKMSPHPFMTQSFLQSREAALQRVIEKLKKGLKL